MSEKVTIEIADGDMADLREWARNCEETVDALVLQALQRYMAAVREDNADLDRRAAGPFHEHEEAMAILAERRQRRRSEAAE